MNIIEKFLIILFYVQFQLFERMDAKIEHTFDNLHHRFNKRGIESRHRDSKKQIRTHDIISFSKMSATTSHRIISSLFMLYIIYLGFIFGDTFFHTYVNEIYMLSLIGISVFISIHYFNFDKACRCIPVLIRYERTNVRNRRKLYLFFHATALIYVVSLFALPIIFR